MASLIARKGPSVSRQGSLWTKHLQVLLILLTLLSFAWLLPVVTKPLLELSVVQAAFFEDTNPRSDYWRDVREGQSGYSAVPGDERGVLIHNGGENWRQIRNGWIAPLTPWLPAAMILAIGSFYIYRGRIRVEEPRSGQRIKRWTLGERILHWYTASLFIILAITGMSLLFGRALLIPVLGREAFADYAQVAMTLHNYGGPLFSLGVLLMILLWAKDNVPTATDIEWFKKAGGMAKPGQHAPAGRMNGGEKAWFWFIASIGVLVIISGFILDFPNFEQDRGIMQISHVVHAILAMAWIALSLGHIYIGTLGTEGAFEGMVKGHVSAEWARQHHDLWYDAINQGKDQSS